jgi:hypothetical protein
MVTPGELEVAKQNWRRELPQWKPVVRGKGLKYYAS